MATLKSLYNGPVPKEKQYSENKRIMDTRKSPTVAFFLPTAIILIVIGWGGLLATLNLLEPSGGTRWVFFFTTVLALTGTFLPLVAFLNQRFPSQPPPTSMVILRQSLWSGIYVATLAWLMIGGVLNPAIGALLAIGIVLIEWMLRLRERSQWRP